MTSNRALNWLRRLRTDDCGAAALEFAIVASVFITAAIGVIEFGRSLQVRNQMAYALDWGARTMLMDVDASEDDITEAIKARFSLYDEKDLTVEAPEKTITCDSGGSMEARTIKLHYPLDIFIPGFTGTLALSMERTVPKGTGGCTV